MKKNFRRFSINGWINFTFGVLKDLGGFARKYSTIKDSNTFPSPIHLDYNPFSAPIPVDYIRSKGKPLYHHITMDKFYEGIYDIKNKISRDVDYTVYIKVKYTKDGNKHKYFMAGNQFGFKYSSIDNLHEIRRIVTDRLAPYFGYYKLTDRDIEYVELAFRQFNTRLLSEFSKEDFKHKHLMNREDINIKKNMLDLPVSVAEDFLGKPLDVVINEGYITNIPIKIDGRDKDFLKIIQDKTKLLSVNHDDKINSFDSGFKFYFVNEVNPYILAIKHKDDSILKIKYSLNGVIINSVTDIKVGNSIVGSKHNNSLIIRRSGQKEILFDDNYKPIYMKENQKLRAIEKGRKVSNLFVANPNIGVIDTETYTSSDDIQKIYCLGFKTNLAPSPKTYYIDDKLDSTKIVLEMIDELLRPKYNKTFFYCHNLSGYDIVFILKTLCDYNEYSHNKYKINTVLRDDKIIKVTISKDGRRFSIADSYTMLNDSLDVLAKNFEVDTLKSKFPYKFSIESNLFYKGNTPDKSLYDNISDDEYKNIYSTY
jgi:hypothetical protein